MEWNSSHLILLPAEKSKVSNSREEAWSVVDPMPVPVPTCSNTPRHEADGEKMATESHCWDPNLLYSPEYLPDVNEPKPVRKVVAIRPRKKPKNKSTDEVQKLKRNSGENYISRKGILKTVKKDLRPGCTACPLKCSIKRTNERRQEINDVFWKLASLQRQREFIKDALTPIIAERQRVTKDRKIERRPNLSFVLDGIKVCKFFFMATLGINSRWITTVRNKTSDLGVLGLEGRGKNGKKKIPEGYKISIRAHIDSIPRIPSHNLRQRTKREYIDGSKSIAQRHRDYAALQLLKKEEVAPLHVYRQVFNCEYNLGLFVPRKN